MNAQRAVHRNESVADRFAAGGARSALAARSDRETPYARRKRHEHPRVVAVRARRLRPVFVDEVAVAQVLDAGAAQCAQPGERRRIGADRDEDVHPVACAFERRTVARRAEKNERLQLTQPGVFRVARVMAGTSHDQAAHAVADDDQFFDRPPPR